MSNFESLLSVCTRYIKQLVKAPKRKYKKMKWESRLRGTPEERFTRIYKDRAWSSKESISGTGSELKYTEKLRRALPAVLTTFSIKRVLDAPCGDFNWMKHVVADTDIEYIGGDIVKELVQDNNEKYASGNISFIHLDITKDALPSADLAIVRDCLFHLSYKDIHNFLVNFEKANIPYLLTTTHTLGNFANKDIQTGDFRFIDLFSDPFGFPNEPLFRVDDYIEGHVAREMCLFTKEQVLVAASRMEATFG